MVPWLAVMTVAFLNTMSGGGVCCAYADPESAAQTKAVAITPVTQLARCGNGGAPGRSGSKVYIRMPPQVVQEDWDDKTGTGMRKVLGGMVQHSGCIAPRMLTGLWNPNGGEKIGRTVSASNADAEPTRAPSTGS
jgi:hypothetical protein